MKNLICTSGTFFLILLLLYLVTAIAIGEENKAANVAKVVIIRGDVSAKEKSGNVKSVKKDDWITEGSIIETQDKSFVKLIFIDQSQVNVGPKSQMEINKFQKNAPGLISLIKGQIRSTVTKDYLKQNPGDESSKLFIKTQSAALGIRGTDFQVIFNSETNLTSLLTFSGQVKMGAIDPAESKNVDYQKMEAKVNSPQAKMVGEGQVSLVKDGNSTPPAKISPSQFESLKNNPELKEAQAESKKNYASPIPPGVSSKSFANTSNAAILESQVKVVVMGAAITSDSKKAEADASTSANESGQDKKVDKQTASTDKSTTATTTTTTTTTSAAAGKTEEGQQGSGDKSATQQQQTTVAADGPPPGGFVDLKTGFYIPPPPGSTFDSNTGVFIPPPNVGGIDLRTGQYLPPQGFTLEASGQFVKVTVPITTENRGPASTTGGAIATTSTAAGLMAPPSMAVLVPNANMTYISPDIPLMNFGGVNMNYAGMMPPTTAVSTYYMGPNMQDLVNKFEQTRDQIFIDQQQTKIETIVTNQVDAVKVNFVINVQ
ncbi:MAG: FecR domain-containing protein [Oligoflexia bacterium]|nr:FecR domain-containing protein [Oligoflexia bacterium]